MLRKHTKVFSVFSFLYLKSPDICWYQWIYPTAAFAIVFVCFHLFGNRFITFDPVKLISEINSWMGLLVAFYIAALAAVASFTSENLDKVMKGRTPTLTVVRQSKTTTEPLTRRRFLAVLFGYCATLSILLYIFGILLIHVSITLPYPAWINAALRKLELCAWAVYTWMLCSLLVATFLGLHYLVDRMHRS